jgi:hypothetical protein
MEHPPRTSGAYLAGHTETRGNSPLESTYETAPREANHGYCSMEEVKYCRSTLHPRQRKSVMRVA